MWAEELHRMGRCVQGTVVYIRLGLQQQRHPKAEPILTPPPLPAVGAGEPGRAGRRRV